MTLSEVLKGIQILDKKNYNFNAASNGLALDSRKIFVGYTFFAVKGAIIDGHTFIDNAIKKGASAIICQEFPKTLNSSVAYILVQDVQDAVALAASNFYDHPSTKLKLIGITGTNGKTTTVTILHRLLNVLGYKSGLLSTVRYHNGDTEVEASLTTPDSITINQKLVEMVDNECQYAFMEVSSHAIAQKRISGLKFSVGLFTNISQDHLDYHGDFKTYILTKKKFFDYLAKDAVALYNADSKHGSVMVQNTAAMKKSYALFTMADYKGRILESTMNGLKLEINRQAFYSRMVGEFNAYNLLAAYGIARELGLPAEELLIQLSNIKTADGRFELIMWTDKRVHIIIDYAHTPDALENVLKTANQTKKRISSVITVVGCGGDRDTGKRPIMGDIASRLSDRVIFTSDNPRSENPYQILEQIMSGVEERLLVKVQVIENRKNAIQTGLRIAKEGDVLIIAGKGHEAYQQIGDIKHPFDDRKVVREFIARSDD